MISDVLARRRAHLLGGSCAAGLSAATVARVGSLAILVAVAAVASTALVARDPARLVLLTAALFVSGWWWGSARLDAIDHSVLAPEVGAYGDALAVVTAPARRTPYEVRVPARVLRFRERDVSETVQLELPPARAPPQGAVLSLFAEVVEPEHDEDFDERTFLRRRGVHVILRARDWRIVGSRGGIGGFADRLRRTLVRGLDGLTGERRAVLAGVVLGEDEGLSEGLRDAFRTSGLYHLLAVSGQNVALLATGIVLFGVARPPSPARHRAHDDRGDRRVRARGRLAAVGRARGCGRRPGVDRLARRTRTRSAGGCSSRVRSSCSRGAPTRCSSRASSSRSPR